MYSLQVIIISVKCRADSVQCTVHTVHMLCKKSTVYRVLSILTPSKIAGGWQNLLMDALVGEVGSQRGLVAVAGGRGSRRVAGGGRCSWTEGPDWSFGAGLD